MKKGRDFSVPVQKGPIVADQPNYKFLKEPAKTRQDIEWNIERQAGKTMTLHTPTKAR
jgi:hypothetical protein